MKTLSSIEIMGQLKACGISKKKDLVLCLIMYKSYFSLNHCRTLRYVKGLKEFVDTYLKKYDRVHISYVPGSET